VRAKRKIVEANIPYRVPEGQTDPACRRRAAFLSDFNEVTEPRTAGASRRDLAEDAMWLTSLVASFCPNRRVLGLIVLDEAASGARGAFRRDGESSCCPTRTALCGIRRRCPGVEF